MPSTTAAPPTQPAPPVLSPYAEWGILGAIVIYSVTHWVGPLMKTSAKTTDAETRRVDDMINFQRQQLTGLTSAIQEQTRVVSEQTLVVTQLTLTVDKLVTKCQSEEN